jgi:hypothetical protein
LKLAARAEDRALQARARCALPALRENLTAALIGHPRIRSGQTRGRPFFGSSNWGSRAAGPELIILMHVRSAVRAMITVPAPSRASTELAQGRSSGAAAVALRGRG